VIAVIRSTGQSLLDYVPEGPTREGFAGTYATQDNFALMRAALDEVSAELGRYVRLTNYASGCACRRLPPSPAWNAST
jgi:beta-lysine 5,6-aminomutase alpha subunit